MGKSHGKGEERGRRKERMAERSFGVDLIRNVRIESIPWLRLTLSWQSREVHFCTTTKILSLSHQITPITDPEYPKQCLMYLQDRGKVGLRSLLPALLSKVQVRNAKSLVECVMLPCRAFPARLWNWRVGPQCERRAARNFRLETEDSGP